MKSLSFKTSKFKYFIAICALMLITNCEKDELNKNVTKESNNTALRISYKSSQEIKSNEKISKKLKEYSPRTKDFNYREVYNEEYDFYIETDSVKYMESHDGSFHSYTFPISKDDVNQSIQNLVLSSTNDSDYVATLITYNLNATQITELTDTDHISTSYNVEAQSLNGDFSNLLNRDDDLCDLVALTYHVTPDTGETWFFNDDSVCQHIDPLTGETECAVHTITILDCPDAVDGGGTSTDSGNETNWAWSYTSGGSGAANSTNGNQTIGSSPTVPFFTKSFSMFLSDLPFEQQDVLNSSYENFNVKLIFQNFLEVNGYTSENEAFANDLIGAIVEDTIIDQNAVSFLLEAHIQDKIYNEFDFQFLSSVNKYMDMDFTSQIDLTDPVYLHYVAKMALLKTLNPEWSYLRAAYEATKDVIHILLDGFGLVPVFGEVADLINGGLYILEGDGVNAGLSLAAAVPIYGWAPTGTKWAIRLTDATQTVYSVQTKVKLTYKVLENGIIYFGSNSTCRRQLRKALGMGPYAQDARQAHHIIPLNLQTHPAVQKAARSENAFHLNESLNGVPLGNNVHNGSHNIYDDRIREYLDEIDLNQPLNNIFDDLVDIINNVKTAVENNPATHINQLIF